MKQLFAGVSLVLVIVVCFLTVGYRRLQIENARMEAQLTAALRERDQANSRARENGDQLRTLRSEIAVAAPATAVPFETALDKWLGKVKALSDYLAKHPNLRIAQMSSLSAEDWLDVTKGEKFETDADYRQALGRLRGMARQKSGVAIAKALKQAIRANGGSVPADLSQLAGYLPPDVDPALLGQLVPNPSGIMDGLRLNGSTKIVAIDKPLDLWDATLFYMDDGGYGSRSSFVKGQTELRAAIDEFTTKNGVPPTSVSQLAGTKGVAAVDPAALNELFAAMTSRP